MNYYMNNSSDESKKEYLLDDTSLPILVLDKDKMGREYPKIDEGGEGFVFEYNTDIVLKNFCVLEYLGEDVKKKFKKIEYLAKLKDESFCFPLGLFGYEDLKKEGYYMRRIYPSMQYKNFDCLNDCFGDENVFQCMILASEAMKRIHEQGVVIGDIRGSNIMIDEFNNPQFIDTDNYAYHGYSFDLADCNTEWLSVTFHKKFSPYDNDKYVYAMLCMRYFIPELPLWIRQSKEFFKKFNDLLDVSPSVRDGIKLIFSDAKDKPYFGEVLKEMSPKTRILTKKNVDLLRHF